MIYVDLYQDEYRRVSLKISTVKFNFVVDQRKLKLETFFSGKTYQVEWQARGQTTLSADPVTGFGTVTFFLDMYQSPDFTDKIDNSQYPIRVSIEDDIYLEVRGN